MENPTRARIVLLDDDPYFRRLVTTALEADGFEVASASKGSVATQMIADLQPNAVVVDGLLPDTNGIDWIRKLRQSGSDLPIVFVSAFFRDLGSYKQLTQELGVARVIYKPANPEAISRSLVDVIGPQPIKTKGQFGDSSADMDPVHEADEDPFFISHDDVITATPPYASPETAEVPSPCTSRLCERDVLVIDQDARFLHHLKTSSTDHMLHLTVVSSIDEAKCIVAEKPPRMAWIGMPLGTDEASLDLIRDIRRSCPAAPIGVISLDDTLEARMNAVRAGADVFLPHPVDAFDLDRAIIAHLPNPTSIRSILLFGSSGAGIGDQQTLQHGAADTRLYSEPEAFFRGFDEHRPHVIALDAQNPEAMELCGAIRAIPRWRGTPIFFIVDASNPAGRGAWLAAGADDELARSDRNSWRRIIAIWRHRRQQTVGGSGENPVTGLPNRRPLLARLQSRFSQAQRHRQACSICIVRLDHAERLQSIHGPRGYECALETLGHLLAGRLRAEDVRGHWNPDDFIVGMSRVNATTLVPVWQRLQKDFQTLDIPGIGDQSFRATFSLGMASYPDAGRSLHDLLVEADKSLLQAHERMA